MTASLVDYEWLVSPAAEPWLGRAREFLGSDGAEVLSAISRLRKELSPERAHLVVEQTELRRRATEKFSLAKQMFFTRQSLEQATDECLAACKAARFPAGESIADFCCGIGGDLMALGKCGAAVGVDLDPALAILATANAAACGLDRSRCHAVASDARDYPVSDVGGWHIDPDRRLEGRRTTRGELFEPSLDEIGRMLKANDRGAIKLAPATAVPAEWSDAAELEWLSSRGECRQQVAWFGSLAQHPGRRSATVVHRDGKALTIVGTGDEAVPTVGQLKRFIYEPDAAILAAKLTAAICREHKIAAIEPGVAYLTGEEPIADALLDVFEVLDCLPLDRKQVKAYCRERGIGRLEIKKRSVDIKPEQFRKQVVGTGDNEATTILCPIGGQSRAVFVRRLIPVARPSRP